jgi:hypothetical protein
MAFSRGALRAFHHQLGFACRRLRHGCPTIADELLPATQELQKKIVQFSHRIPNKGNSCKWPPWRQHKQEQQQQRKAMADLGSMPIPEEMGHDHGTSALPVVERLTASHPRSVSSNMTPKRRCTPGKKMKSVRQNLGRMVLRCLEVSAVAPPLATTLVAPALGVAPRPEQDKRNLLEVVLASQAMQRPPISVCGPTP